MKERSHTKKELFDKIKLLWKKFDLYPSNACERTKEEREAYNNLIVEIRALVDEFLKEDK